MIIITGASKGIGLAIAERLSTRGEEVLGLSRNPGHQIFETKSLDVTDFEAVKKTSDEIRISGKKVTALINVAGIASMNLALLANPMVSEKLVKVNFLGTVFSSQFFAPLLIRNGGGSIINFSTIASAINLEGESIYAATKSAVENYSSTLAKELSKFKINVNCVAPGPIATDLLRGVTSQQIGEIISSQIIRNQYEVQDVADIVELLLESKAKSLTGQIFHIGGVR
jgi:3-oxoacyl-[acyl-carrier protein] reductase